MMTDIEIKSLVGQLLDAARGDQMDRSHCLLMHEVADALTFLREQRQRSKEQFDKIADDCHQILHGEI